MRPGSVITRSSSRWQQRTSPVIGQPVLKCWEAAFKGYCLSDLCVCILLNLIYALLNKTFTVHFPPAAELQFQASES